MTNEGNIKVELHNGTGKKSGKEYHAVKVTIGHWTGMVFPRSNFEWEYIQRAYNDEDFDKD